MWYRVYLHIFLAQPYQRHFQVLDNGTERFSETRLNGNDTK